MQKVCDFSIIILFWVFKINDCTKLLFYENFDYISLRHLIDFATIIQIILRALFAFEIL